MLAEPKGFIRTLFPGYNDAPKSKIAQYKAFREQRFA
jgi:hypothetical protein